MISFWPASLVPISSRLLFFLILNRKLWIKVLDQDIGKDDSLGKACVDIEKLNHEIREKDEEILRSINAGYVKQVLLQFLMTNDSQVQDRMLSVLATLLNFSFEESQKLKDRKSSKGMFSKLLYN